MNITSLMKELYKYLINDEKLLRLLHYIPKNQNDDPLSPSKQSILELPPAERFKIINEVIYFTDKKLKLDLDPKFSRINLYLGNRVPYKSYSRASRRLTNNPNVSKQEIIVDIHTNIEINVVDMRMFSIIDRVNDVLMNKDVKQFIDLKFDFGNTIYQTPDGFIGYRLTYYTLSSQSPNCEV